MSKIRFIRSLANRIFQLRPVSGLQAANAAVFLSQRSSAHFGTAQLGAFVQDDNIETSLRKPFEAKQIIFSYLGDYFHGSFGLLYTSLGASVGSAMGNARVLELNIDLHYT